MKLWACPVAGVGEEPAPWSTAPRSAFGAVNEDTLEHVKRVVRGQVPIPERRVEDASFGLDQDVRRAMVEVEP